jgi:hypothetical protein
MLRWEGHVAHIGEEKLNKTLVGKSERKREHGTRSRRRIILKS